MINPDAMAVLNAVNKKYGDGAVVLAKDIQIHKRFTSGSLGLDVALGGGWPANQPIEIIGLESHGKTAIVLKTLAANMERDPSFTALWVAAEHYDVDQARALGVDNERVIVHSTQSMEEAFEVMLTFGASRAVDAIILDSYPALIPAEEERKDMDEAVVAVGARMVGKFFRKWGATVKHDVTDTGEKPMLGPVIINQFRDKIGSWSPSGTPRTTPGGNAKNYAFYVRVEVARDEWIKESLKGMEIRVGQTIKIKTVKNKSAAPQQVAVLDFYFREAPDHGFHRGEYDLGSDMVLMAVLFDVITKRGSWFYFENGELDTTGKPMHRWQGQREMMAAVKSDLDLMESIDKEVRLRATNPKFLHTISEDDVTAAKNAGARKVARKVGA